jgi:hypothetical protein
MKTIIILSLLLIGYSCKTHSEKLEATQNNSTKIDTDTTIDPKTGRAIKLNGFLILTEENIGQIKINLDSTIHIYPNPNIISEHIDTINKFTTYWALFIQGNRSFIMKKIEAKMELYEGASGALFYRFYTNSEKPIYIFEGIHYDHEFILRGEYPQKYPLRPGDLFLMSTLEENSVLYVTGSVKKGNFNQFEGPFDRITDFNLILQTKIADSLTESIIFKKDTMSIMSDRYEINFGVDWIGDLDLDGKMDMVLNYSNHHASFEYRLYLSSINDIVNFEDYCAKYTYSD